MKQKRNRGFTLAEMLLVVGLIVILSGVAVVAVYQYRRSMRQLEYDAVAKEIFFAAQNHLTMADNQGLLSARTDEGVHDEAEKEAGKDAGVYYFVYPGAADPDEESSVLNLMLPFGSIDETVRLGGSYVIRYQKSSARILEVFYSAPGDQTGLLGGLGCSFSGLTPDGYTALKGYSGEDNKDNRKHYVGPDNNNAVIGWYDGDGLEGSETLAAPSIRVINAERLEVEITNPNADKDFAQLMLLVTEKGEPKHRKAIPLDAASEKITYVLDDISEKNQHFAKLFPDFTPGADIEIKVVAYSNKVLANIAESAAFETNSLFAYDGDGKYGTVDLANIRHLENLDGALSGFNSVKTPVQATQTTDLSWTDFREKLNERKGTTGPIHIVPIDGSQTGDDLFYPIKLDYKLDYDGQDRGGQKHSISDVAINTSGNAGLFSENTVLKSSFSRLELINFDVTSSSGNAGALFGDASDVSVTDVLARNTKEKDSKTSPTVTASGSAGGLIGSLTGGSVKNSAAALVVSGNGDAGGLIGSAADGAVISDSYAGGHTDGNGAYSGQDYNVTGANAGGLIGSLSGTVSNCYSTCSASGSASAGGLIGSASGSVSDSYATGLVNADNTAHALVGTGSVSGSGNKYLWIINQDQPWMQPYLEQYKSSPDAAMADACGQIAATDVTWNTETLTGFFKGSEKAQPYDTKLLASYQGKYPMPTVGQSGSYAASHYGDWPMPETLVINRRVL